MDQQRKKWVTFSFIAVSGLLAFVLSEVLYKLFGTFNLEARLTSMGIRTDVQVTVRIVSLVVAIVTYLILSYHKKANHFMDEVVAELAKVTWPTSSDAAKATGVVVVMVLICGAVLAVQDVFWAWVMRSGLEKLTKLFH